MKELKKIKAYPVVILNPEDLKVVKTINVLPRHLSARELADCLCHEGCGLMAFDMVFLSGLHFFLVI